MEFKNVIELTETRGANVYTLRIPLGASHGEVYDVLFQMLQKVAAEAQRAAQNAPSSITPSSDAAGGTDGD